MGQTQANKRHCSSNPDWNTNWGDEEQVEETAADRPRRRWSWGSVTKADKEQVCGKKVKKRPRPPQQAALGEHGETACYYNEGIRQSSNKTTRECACLSFSSGSFIFIIYLCVCVCVSAHTCHLSCRECIVFRSKFIQECSISQESRWACLSVIVVSEIHTDIHTSCRLSFHNKPHMKCPRCSERDV